MPITYTDVRAAAKNSHRPAGIFKKREVTMNIRKHTLWRVPAYCIAAGLIWFRLMVSVLVPFIRATWPDSSAEEELGMELILYGVIFAVTLFIGWLLFRRMTKREIFWSAAILVGSYLAVFLLNRVFQSSFKPLLMVLMFLTESWGWATFISTFLHWALNGSSILVPALAPFLFVLFGVSDSAGTDP